MFVDDLRNKTKFIVSTFSAPQYYTHTHTHTHTHTVPISAGLRLTSCVIDDRHPAALPDMSPLQLHNSFLMGHKKFSILPDSSVGSVWRGMNQYKLAQW